MANLYVDVDERSTDRLRSTLRRLRNTGRYFLNLRDDDDPVQYLLDVLFPDGALRVWHVANVSLDNAQERTTLALRPVILTPESWPFPRGFSLGVTGSWPRTAPQPVLRIRDVFEIADAPTRAFEAQAEAFVYQAERVPRGVPFADNLLNSRLATALPLISRDTQQRLQDWTGFIEWKRNLVRACARGLRYVARGWSEDGSNLVFRLQVSDDAALIDALKLLRNESLQAFPLEASADPWTFTPVEETEQRGRRARQSAQGTPLGRAAQRDPRRTGRVQPRGDENPGGLGAEWEIAPADEDVDLIAAGADAQAALLARIPEQGFLSISLAGDLSLLRRHEQAMTRLRDQGGYSPYLSAYLFDVKQARCPQCPGPEPAWLSSDLNPPQREAVRKMLDAPDLCLLQGPPGTGKTTMIAEAIAQLVRRGESVLLASQAHTAVDNALARLADNTAVRAIRLGPPGKVTDDGKAFLGAASLGRYYTALAGHAERKHLLPWQRQDEAAKALAAWCERAEFVLADAQAAQERLTRHARSDEALQAALAAAWEDLQGALRAREAADAQRLAAQALGRLAEDPAAAGTAAALPAALLAEVDAAVHAVLDLASHGMPLKATAADWRDLAQQRPQVLALLARDVARARAAWDRLRGDAARIAAQPAAAQDPATRLRIEELAAQEQALMDAAAREDAGPKDVQAWQRKRQELQALRRQGAAAVDAAACRDLFVESQSWLVVGSDAAAWAARLQDRLALIETPLCSAEAALQRLVQAAGRLALAPADVVVDEWPWRQAQAALQRHRAVAAELQQEAESFGARAAQMLVDHPQPGALQSCGGQAQEELRSALATSRQAQQVLQLQAGLQQVQRQTWEPLLREWVRDLREAKSATADWELLELDWPAQCNVVAITCNENPRTLDEQGHSGFDVAIVDEVSKATPLELLLPLMRARRAVLVGDHRQLPPLFQESMDAVTFADAADEAAQSGGNEAAELTEANLKRYERMVTASLFKEHFEQAPDAIRGRLSVQFRMHPQIMQLVNHFYEDTLSCGLADPDKVRSHGLTIPDATGRELLGPDDHVLWIDTSRDLLGQPCTEDFDPQGRPLRTNELEVKLTVQLLERLEAQALATRGPGAKRLTVGVVSFYAGQLRRLRQAIRAAQPPGGWRALDVDSNTVIRYQGKEKDVVLVSLVRNDGGTRRHRSSRSNVARYEFINVAMSRARCLLMVLGARSMFEGFEVPLPRMDGPGVVRRPVYRDMLKRLELDGRLVDARQVMAPPRPAARSPRPQTQGDTTKGGR